MNWPWQTGEMEEVGFLLGWNVSRNSFFKTSATTVIHFYDFNFHLYNLPRSFSKSSCTLPVFPLVSLYFYYRCAAVLGVPQLVLVVKDPLANAGNTKDAGSIPESSRSLGTGSANPLQYSCLENYIAEEPGRIQSMGPKRVRHDWALT